MGQNFWKFLLSLTLLIRFYAVSLNLGYKNILKSLKLTIIL